MQIAQFLQPDFATTSLCKAMDGPIYMGCCYSMADPGVDHIHHLSSQVSMPVEPWSHVCFRHNVSVERMYQRTYEPVVLRCFLVFAMFTGFS